jgi:nucleoside-diphosphate-sugar epimerase
VARETPVLSPYRGESAVSASTWRVRSGRSAPVVAVTMAGSPVGLAICAGLAARAGEPGAPWGVLAVDDVPMPGRIPDGVRWVGSDVTTPTVRTAVAGADVVVHVACPADAVAEEPLTATARRARAVRAVQEVAAAAAEQGVRRLVVVSSAMVYGAGPGRPAPVAEDAPLAATRDQSGVGDLLEVERIVARLPRVHPHLRTTVLRPAAIVGPGVCTTITRHLREPRLLVLRGAEMRWQFCHVDDLADAAALVIAQGLDGVLTAGTLPVLTDAEVEQLTGMHRVELPARLAYVTAERLRRSRALAAGAADLTYVVHPWTVSAERLRAAGWRPRHDPATCLREIRATAEPAPGGPARRVEAREAALGAAGAAVAILGAAALLRQARARRSGRPRPRL